MPSFLLTLHQLPFWRRGADGGFSKCQSDRSTDGRSSLEQKAVRLSKVQRVAVRLFLEADNAKGNPHL